MPVSNDALMKFSMKFRARYGAHRLDDESVGMWFNKLGGMDETQFIVVTEELIGSREHAFGWKVVAEKRELMFPKADEQMALEREWRAHPEYQKNGDKRSYLTKHMNSLIERNQAGEKFDWIGEHAKEFLKTWGNVEAQKQIRAMITDTEESQSFCLAVSELLHENFGKG